MEKRKRIVSSVERIAINAVLGGIVQKIWKGKIMYT